MSESREQALWDQFWPAYEDERYATCSVLLARIRQIEDSPFLGYLNGEVLRRLGRGVEAEEMIRAHYTPSCSFAERAEVSLAQLCVMGGCFAEAEEWFRKAVASNPVKSYPRVFLAAFLADRGRFPEGCQILEEALRTDGMMEEVHLNLGRNFRAMGDYHHAIACFEEALNVAPDYEPAKHDLDDLRQALRIREV